ncbi:MAG: mitofilin family membrane protein, partial [Pseudomonadota bacterium]
DLLALDTRILALETAVPAAGELASGDELAALRERIAEMMASAEAQLNTARDEAAQISKAAEDARLAAEAEVEAAKKAAAAREAELEAAAQRQESLISLKAAVEAGAPFDEIVATLDNVPDVLMASAETGVSTVQSLQQSFPDIARTALAQSSTVSEDASPGERLSAFFQQRVNARSLTPQEGDSPDAILSRAEAILNQGDLSGALTELEALPDGGKAALASWIETAQNRIAALEAVDQLSATN